MQAQSPAAESQPVVASNISTALAGTAPVNNSQPAQPEGLMQAWTRIRARLLRDVGEVEYHTWLRHMALVGIDGDEVTVSLPSRFLRDWVRTTYADKLNGMWQSELPEVRRVDLRIGGGVEPTDLPVPLPVIVAPVAELAAEPKSEAREVAGPLDTRFEFESFIVGKPNEFAYAAARNIAEQDRPLPERNPLYIFGGVGLGKTHLMHAIWHAIRERDPKTRVLYLTAENFVNRFIQALRTKNTNQFKELFRNVDVLMVDDVQFICGKEASQEEFFFTFNSLVEQNKQIVLSSEKPPSELQDIEERMRSRLGSGLVADIHSSTYELRLSILQTKAETARVPVPIQVLEFVAHKISTNIRELEGALNRVVAHGQMLGREITVEMAQDVLHDLLRQADRKVTVDEIQQRVAAHYNIKLAEMSSPRRARSVARPRQVAMYLAKQLTTLSLPQIGKRFGNRDHTTVMHAVRKIEELKISDLSIAEDVELLKRQLQG